MNRHSQHAQNRRNTYEAHPLSALERLEARFQGVEFPDLPDWAQEEAERLMAAVRAAPPRSGAPDDDWGRD